MSDWEEIKRLAADFQRIQLTTTSQKLSEHNCIEIVQKLIDLNLISILHSTNGKEYITPIELEKEILEELILANGRVSLIDLQSILNVDLSHIESKVADLVRQDKNLKIILGQLVDKNYLDHICEEINDKLQEAGILSIPELTRYFDLPADILRQLIDERIGTIIIGQQNANDVEILYTNPYISRHRARIRGILSSITEPIQLAPLITKYGFHTKLFFSILDECISNGFLEGSISGNRPFNAIYTPNIYIRSQQLYVDSFFKINNFIEYGTLNRVGILDHCSYLDRQFKKDKLLHLSTCCIGEAMLGRVESELEESLEASSVSNILNFLPSICSAEDGSLVLNKLAKKFPNCIILKDTYIVKRKLIETYVEKLHPLVKSRAIQAVKENPSLLLSSDKKSNKQKEEQNNDDKMDYKKKKTSTKTVYGTQGREVKTKSVKKKYHGGSTKKVEDEDYSDVDETNSKDTPNFLLIKELSNEIKEFKLIEENDGDLLCPAIAQLVQSQLIDEYNSELKNIFLQTLNINLNNTEPEDAKSLKTDNENIDKTEKVKISSNRKLRMELGDKLNNAIVTSHLYEKGIQLFNDDSIIILSQHFLKTIGQDIVSLIFSLYAVEFGFTKADEVIKIEDRNNIMSLIKDDKTKSALQKLVTSLNSKALDDFYKQLDILSGPTFLDLSQKKIDKKKERQLLFNNRQSLLQQLNSSSDAASVLHLASTLHLMINYNVALTSPGKFVPTIIEFLREKLEQAQLELLVQCQENVVGKMKSMNDENKRKEYDEILNVLIPQIKKSFEKNKENISKD